jgi:hypothetical protein
VRLVTRPCNTTWPAFEVYSDEIRTRSRVQIIQFAAYCSDIISEDCSYKAWLITHTPGNSKQIFETVFLYLHKNLLRTIEIFTDTDSDMIPSQQKSGARNAN